MVYSNRKVGGIRFIKLGKLNFSFSVSKSTRKVALPGTVYPALTNAERKVYAAELSAKGAW